MVIKFFIVTNITYFYTKIATERCNGIWEKMVQ